MGLRPQVEASFDGRFGGGLVLEVQPALAGPLSLLIRGRTARFGSARVHQTLGWMPMTRQEASLTAGLMARILAFGDLWLEGALAGGVAWTGSRLVGGCRPPAGCSLAAAAPVIAPEERLEAVGEASVGLLWKIGPRWGLELSCTFALSADEPARDALMMTTGLTIRSGAGLRVELP